MNTEKLSQRLEAVANYIPKGCRLADIGSDHAYLPCYAVKQGLIPFAIAGEVVEGPYQSAKSQVEAEGLNDKINVRKGNGLKVISEGEVDCITIAGMGGALITNILEEGKEKLGTIKRLILQPNVSAITIRSWLIENGWVLVAEEILEEDEKIYEILVAEKGDAKEKQAWDLQIELLFGPFLLKEKSAVFKKKWLGELRNWQRILGQLENAANTEETVEKKNELLEKIKMVGEVLGH
ncbi:tRNA (adenine(22)-N(1))-methyltransferase TrmK [Bacillus sp. DTU_2020_1000418_1_SI_GHA_SEK_038]|uniref:tRNA (adenine(22)-N(1))-methyltransferase n=1 Tax=Bacillus sp. DTU_2020_1000418_1_SI_GHA_SEK_038 TaxID=3077585 RepID=UPI0028E8A35B|nr:tRNA (adenine(22)-N(1))-methyltransferase TrmK [Bacillus sp. DTU_2020_1000418_1_SI_GHA_SEK_038]WNS74326.1 tRNA (adenine(22)-N(1))-methyltransferase TrmK [Bacillus sp. DTU_2020_1000418_1_SI_GHA_SEK_038]